MKNTHQFSSNISYTLHFQGLLSCNYLQQNYEKKGRLAQHELIKARIWK